MQTSPAPAGSRPAGPVSRREAQKATVTAAAVGLAVAAVARKGGFHQRDALIVAVAAALVVAVRVAVGVGRRTVTVLLPVLALAAWWLASARMHGSASSFLPFGAGMLAFAAGLVALDGVPPDWRRSVQAALLGIGALSAAAGLVGEAFRLWPLAARAQDLWRIGTTLTYANAAGLLLAMTLLLGLGLELDRGAPFVRVGLCLCAAALVATQSRGAAVACVLSLPFVPWARLRASLGPLAAGLGAGLVAVATSSGDGTKPLVVVVALLAIGLAVVAGPGASRPWRGLHRAGAAGAVALVTAGALSVALGGGHPQLSKRLEQDRTPEWHAALSQFTSSPLTGVGPDKPLVLDAQTATTTDFAHDEYLQVLAGGGLLGGGLLVAVGAALVATARRRDVPSSSAVAALVAFAVAGAFDYDWHLPALALVAGLAAAVALAGAEVSPNAPPPPDRP
jgi:hypothetical protein